MDYDLPESKWQQKCHNGKEITSIFQLLTMDAELLPNIMKINRKLFAMTDPREHFLLIVGVLRLIIRENSDYLDEKNIEILNDFIDNNEFGIALEWLHSICVERRIILSVEHTEKLQRVACLMKIDLT
jgi:hypothetical protein